MMRARDAATEALRNLRTGTGRPVAIAIAVTLCAVILVGIEVGSVAMLVTRANEFQTAGGSTLILESAQQIDAGACHRLESLGGVDGAAAVTVNSRTAHPANLPQQSIPVVRATPGLAGILGIHPEGVGVWVSQEAADQLGTQVGSTIVLDGQSTRVAAVYPYPEDGRRPGLGYAVVEPVPASGVFDECWVRSWPVNDAIVPVLTATSFHPAPEQSPRLLSQLNGTKGSNFDGAGELARRPSSLAGSAALVAGLLIGYAAWRLRRLELASARHAGVPTRALWLTALVELCALLAIMWAWGAVVALWVTRGLAPSDAGQVLPFAARVLLSMSVGLILGASVAVWTARERQLFDFFKGR
jgi:hypothetical protein